jgi:ParB family chromosome partitioning protein
MRQWIDEQGLLLPILVRRLNSIDPAEYEIVSGESYWKAAQELQIYRVPVLIRNDLSDNNVRTALNLEREGGRRSDPIAEARAIAELKNAGLTDHEIGGHLGMPRHQITQARRLLNLIEPVQAVLIGGRISVGHARVLASLDKDHQERLLREITTKRLSVRKTEGCANEIRDRCGRGGGAAPDPVADNKVQKDPATRQLEREISETLGCPFSFELHKDGSGRVVIEYSDLDVLDGVLERIRGVPNY